MNIPIQWRRVAFFDREVIEFPATDVNLKDVNISCCASGNGQLVLGDRYGSVYLVNRDLSIYDFEAHHTSLSHLHRARQTDILITVGQDERGGGSIVKVWSTIKLYCLALHDNMNLLALGFADGLVLLLRGDISRGSKTKPQVLCPSAATESRRAEPITALAFSAQPSRSGSPALFIVSQRSVRVIDVQARDKFIVSTLDAEMGAPLFCSALAEHPSQEAQLAVATPEAVYFYTSEDRGSCVGVSGEKVRVHFSGSYLVVISRGTGEIPNSSGGGEKHILTVFDTRLKLMAHSEPLPSVVGVASEWGALQLVCSDGQVHQLVEKDTQSKLDLLFRKAMYQTALDMAARRQFDETQMAEIHRQYADYLYADGQLDEAVKQYKETIGFVEPSYVITKFMDSRRIKNLADYLEALHAAPCNERGDKLANQDHTTLLLNCYTRLKDVEKIDRLTERERADFDVDTAIRVCRKAGYARQALRLARRHGRHDLYLQMQLEQQGGSGGAGGGGGDRSEALSYIGRLPFDEAVAAMRLYGRRLMTEAPERTTALLTRLCTDYRPDGVPMVTESELSGAEVTREIQRARPEEFLDVFSDQTEWLCSFLEQMVEGGTADSPLLYITLLELYLRAAANATDPAERARKELPITKLLTKHDAQLDFERASALCHAFNCRPALLHIYEKTRAFSSILQLHMDASDYPNVLATCQRFGHIDPHLWSSALSFLADQPNQESQTALGELIRSAQSDERLSPLELVRLLARRPHATLDVCRDFLVDFLQRQSQQTAADEERIASLRAETERTRALTRQLLTGPRTFQVTKCSICSNQIELPSVNFLCGHSYHQECFDSYAGEDKDCVVCQKAHREVRSKLRSDASSGDLYDRLRSQLRSAKDPFSVMTDYYGQGVFASTSSPPEGASLNGPPSTALNSNSRQLKPNSPPSQRSTNPFDSD